MGHANTTGRKGLKSRISRLRRIRGTYGNTNSLICDERENMKTVCDNKAYWGINTRLTICFVTGVYSREPNTYAQTREELGLATVIWHKQTAHGFFLDNSPTSPEWIWRRIPEICSVLLALVKCDLFTGTLISEWQKNASDLRSGWNNTVMRRVTIEKIFPGHIGPSQVR